MSLPGVLFGTKHSSEYNIIMKSKSIGAPVPKTNFIDIPGADGSIDATEAISDVKYERRQISIEFACIKMRNEWTDIYASIMDELNGKSMHMIFDDDSYYYYDGRIKVNTWKSSKETGLIVIEGNCMPYKKEYDIQGYDWLWDDFNFETSILREYKITSPGTIKVVGDRQKVVPVFTCSDAMTVTYGGQTYNLRVGNNKVYDIAMGAGDHVLTFAGAGTVTVTYRGGRL